MRTALSAMALAAALIIPTGGAAAAQTTGAAEPPEGVPWVLTALVMDGELTDTPDGVDPTLLLASGQASGSAGCNSFSGPYTLRGDALTFGPAATTMMLCAETPMAVEAAYLADLGRVASFELDRKGMTLRDARGSDLLTFVGTQAQSITGGWVVDAYRTSDRDLVSPMPGTLLTAVFGADGVVEGSSGCNHFSASYTADGQDLTIGTLSSTNMACATPESQAQEQQFLAALGASNRWSSDGQSLELVDAKGVGKDTTLKLSAENQASYLGSWVVAGFDMGNGSMVAPVAGSSLTAVIDVSGSIEGSTGCNSYNGPYTVDGWAMTIGPLAMTRAACSDELGTQEQQFVAALQTVTSWAADGVGIVLRGADGQSKVTLAPAS